MHNFTPFVQPFWQDTPALAAVSSTARVLTGGRECVEGGVIAGNDGEWFGEGLKDSGEPAKWFG